MRPREESFCAVDEVTLCYETFGRAEDPALLLIMGLGMQMIAWDDDFCTGLAERGFYVIRFDNRDTGHSTRFDQIPPPTLTELTRRRLEHPAYTLSDMARDAAGLLDQLEVDRAHVVGASMGAMIGQVLAAERTARVLSLVSIMGSTGSRLSGQPSPRVLPIFLRPSPTDRKGYLERAMKVFTMIRSPGYEADPERLRAMLELSFDRGNSPAGTARQLGAIVSSGDRKHALARISAPTLVIHGMADRLVRPSGGRATAAAIPGAHLLLLSGMGHDLPRQLWPMLLDVIAANARRAGEPAPGSGPDPAPNSDGDPAAFGQLDELDQDIPQLQ
jgi:pimeloyl-ACP methyl ester carboxylesterase